MNIGEVSMSSEQTRHTARREMRGWELSWLPGRYLDRNQAISGMMLAETVAAEEMHNDNPAWHRVEQWAKELGLAGPDAVVRASEAPE